MITAFIRSCITRFCAEVSANGETPMQGIVREIETINVLAVNDIPLKVGATLDLMEDVYDDLKRMKPVTLEQITAPGGLLDQIIEKTVEELLAIKAPAPTSA
ncbi:MAG: hypothetical protein WC802_00595 [Patescibacteria group bacterium]|jgi:hypothetical protein